MDTPTAQTAINSRAVTPLMPETEKEAGGVPRLSRTDTLTVVSTHDSRNGANPNPSTEKNLGIPATTETEAETDESTSTILTGRKLFLVFVYVAYLPHINVPLLTSSP
jgi:hypothetical protein